MKLFTLSEGSVTPGMVAEEIFGNGAMFVGPLAQRPLEVVAGEKFVFSGSVVDDSLTLEGDRGFEDEDERELEKKMALVYVVDNLLPMAEEVVGELRVCDLIVDAVAEPGPGAGFVTLFPGGICPVKGGFLFWDADGETLSLVIEHPGLEMVGSDVFVRSNRYISTASWGDKWAPVLGKLWESHWS